MQKEKPTLVKCNSFADFTAILKSIQCDVTALRKDVALLLEEGLDEEYSDEERYAEEGRDLQRKRFEACSYLTQLSSSSARTNGPIPAQEEPDRTEMK